MPPTSRYAPAVLALACCLAVQTAGAASDQGGTSMTAAAALQRLKEGNQRFVADAAAGLPVDNGRRAALALGQAPYALVLSCADSRVPPEIIFNSGLGELFVVRSAGEVLDKSVLASLEYGADHLHAPLLVVMGHEFCGAVKAAVETGSHAKSMGPNLDFLLKQIQPAVSRAAQSIFVEPLRAAILANVELVVDDLRAQSPILRKLVDSGKLQMVGAFYELSSGEVTFSHPVVPSAKAPATQSTSHNPAPRPVASAPPAHAPEPVRSWKSPASSGQARPQPKKAPSEH